MIHDSTMNLNQYLINIKPFIKKNLLVLGLGFFGLIFFVYGLIALLGETSSSEEIIFEQGSEASLENSSNKSYIKVDIQGEVLKPGVHSLSYDARLQDALVSAGGLSDSADREWAAKNLNLAQKLTDGAKFYIPKKGEKINMDIGNSTGLSLNAKIDINSDSLNRLDELPGIGPVTAGKIIENRPYAAIEDLLTKKIVGDKVFERIREKITVY